MSVNIILSFNTDIPKDILPDFRDYLRREITGIDFNLQESSVLPGRLGLPWNEFFIHAAVVSVSEKLLSLALEPTIEGIAQKIGKVREKFMHEKELKKLDINGSITSGNGNRSFRITGENDFSYFKDPIYSIDPTHTHVLLVGCGKYNDKKIPKVPAVEENLKTFYELLTDKRYFGIPPTNVIVSLNDSYSVVKRLMYDVSRKPEIETFLLYFVGHGFSMGINKYFLAVSDTEKENDFVNSAIEQEFIKDNILSFSPAKQKIAIIDACYSGMLTLNSKNAYFDYQVEGSYILTSSSAEEVSFYHEKERYTYFTGALLQIVMNGVNNDRDSITLEDIYRETSAQMREKKLQQPTYKNGLNIKPSSFIISRNVAYSIENEILKLNLLMSQVKYEEAEVMVQRLMQKFPDEKQLKEKAVQISKDKIYNDFVHKGDTCYYTEKNYQKALEFYRQAAELKPDTQLHTKIQQSIQRASLKPSVSTNQSITPSNHSKPLDDDYEQLGGAPRDGSRQTATSSKKSGQSEPEPQDRINERMKKLRKWIVSTVAVFCAITFALIVGHYAGSPEGHKSEKDTLSTLKPKTPSTSEQPTPNAIVISELQTADDAFEQNDYESALKLYIKNEVFLDRDQLLSVGWIFENNKDLGKAKDYYQQASNRGSEKALNYLNNLQNSSLLSEH